MVCDTVSRRFRLSPRRVSDPQGPGAYHARYSKGGSRKAP